MSSREPGIDKPFDRMIKDFGAEAPRMLAHLLGIANLTSTIDVQPVRPETAPSVRMADYVAFIVEPFGPPTVFHAEFIVTYASDTPETMVEYGARLALQYRRLVRSVAVLLHPGRTPKSVPESGELIIGVTRFTHQYRVVRMWEIDPTPIFQVGDIRLLPWAVLMNTTDAQVRELAARLGSSGDEESIARFLTLGSIRYDRRVLEEMLGGRQMGFVEAFMETSSLVQEVRDKAAGQGHADGSRRTIRRYLQAKHPGLELLPEIDAITAQADLDALFDTVVQLSTWDEVRLAILTAARR